MKRMNVESFNLDHRAVAAPYVRIADEKQIGTDGLLTKYDVRFTQPNEDHLEMVAIHSLEHSFAECARNHADDVIDFSPMGCQTGFYLLRASGPDLEGTMALIEHTLADILEMTDVPAANEVQCGWGANHSLEAAQDAARAMLEKRSEWSRVMKDEA